MFFAFLVKMVYNIKGQNLLPLGAFSLYTRRFRQKGLASTEAKRYKKFPLKNEGHQPRVSISKHIIN